MGYSNKNLNILFEEIIMAEMHIDKNTPVEKLTPGGVIYQAGNAREFKTGDWRSMCPVWHEEKCTQCGL